VDKVGEVVAALEGFPMRISSKSQVKERNIGYSIYFV